MMANPGGTTPGGLEAEYASEEYNFSFPKRGTAIIINNINFSKATRQADRGGAEKDAKNLYDTFDFLGFDVRSFTNLTTTDMLKELQNVAKEDHSQEDCLVCCICSHGDQDVQQSAGNSYKVSDLVYGTDGILYIRLITEIFNNENCPTLAGKPRLFFLQACRGQELSESVEVSDGPEGADYDYWNEFMVTQEIPIYKDALLAYSSPPGFFAFRRGSGSWFITALCQVLQMYSLDMDLMTLLTRVNHQVAYEFESNRATVPMLHKRHVVPWVASMLIKEVKFSRKNTSEGRIVFV